MPCSSKLMLSPSSLIILPMSQWHTHIIHKLHGLFWMLLCCMCYGVCCIFLFPEIHVCFLQTNWKFPKEMREFLFQETGIVLNGNNHLLTCYKSSNYAAKAPDLHGQPCPQQVRWIGFGSHRHLGGMSYLAVCRAEVYVCLFFIIQGYVFHE